MTFRTVEDNRSPTQLLAKNHDSNPLEEYRERKGTCYFCGITGLGLPIENVISEEYFSDHDLRSTPHSDQVCAFCAYCMDHRELKQGHWVVTSDEYRSVSTGGLLDVFQELRDGRLDPPLAVHVSKNPIRSEHAYLWTPVNESIPPLVVSYDRQTVRIVDWRSFSRLVATVEDLRLQGFTFDELRSGEPRVRNVREIGRESYRRRADVIEPHRRTARLELVLTLSRGADDQPRTDLTQDYDPFT